ncbi:MAG: hypothetical protein JXA04_00095 [Gammaproteobacteria bacterium]|nr:hypothetical protein [Gammaproteobacteria bacterium]
MIVNKEVMNSPLLWKIQKPADIKEMRHTHRVSAIFEDPSNNNQRVEIHQLAQDMYYLSILFYLPGVLALMYVVFVS